MEYWYVFERDGDYQVASANEYSPLHGRGSWNLASPGFDTREEAEAYAAERYPVE
jgi:hypothetical protein